MISRNNHILKFETPFLLRNHNIKQKEKEKKKKKRETMAGKWETLNEVKDVMTTTTNHVVENPFFQNGEELDATLRGKHRQMFRRGWVDMGATSDGWTDIASQPKMSPHPLKKAGVSKPFFRFRRPSDEAINTAALFSSY